MLGAISEAAPDGPLAVGEGASVLESVLGVAIGAVLEVALGADWTDTAPAAPHPLTPTATARIAAASPGPVCRTLNQPALRVTCDLTWRCRPRCWRRCHALEW